uniref:Uncharacterized protein n=1 Tax=Arundo donax TaxID=35708 RepID=A0A0A9FQ28_ARUDO
MFRGHICITNTTRLLTYSKVLFTTLVQIHSTQCSYLTFPLVMHMSYIIVSYMKTWSHIFYFSN